MNQTKPIDLFLDDAQLAAIGHYTAQWAFFETEMEFTISAMSHMVLGDKSMPLPFADRIKHWRRMISTLHRDNEIVAIEYRDITEAAELAHETRTMFVHASIIGDPKRKSRQICFEHHRHRKHNWTSQAAFVTPKWITTAARELGRVSATLMDLNAVHLPVSPPSLPRTFPPQGGGGVLHHRPGPNQKTKSRTRLRSSRA